MALTPAAAWTLAAEQTPNFPRVMFEIYDGVNTWRCLDDFCDNIVDDVGLLNVSSVSAEMDPFTRKVQTSTVTVTVADAWIRPILVNNYIRGQRVRISLGFKGILESEFLRIFTGTVESQQPLAGAHSVEIECLDVFGQLETRDITGWWINDHPLTIVENILDRAGVADSLIDSLSLKPFGVDDAAFVGTGNDDMTAGGSYTSAGTATFVVTIDGESPGVGPADTYAWTKDGGGGAAGVAITGAAQTLSDGVEVKFVATTNHDLGDAWTFGTSDELQSISHLVTSRGPVWLGWHEDESDLVLRDPVKAWDLVDEIAGLLNGHFVPNEAGEIGFSRFDSAAAADDHWDKETITSFQQRELDANIVNEISVSFARSRASTYRRDVTRGDETSQAAFAYPGELKRIIAENIETPWLDAVWLGLAFDINNAQTDLVFSGAAHAITGCNWSPSHPSGFPTGGQETLAKISAARPAYFLISGQNGIEIVKITTAVVIDEDFAERAFIYDDPDGSGDHYTAKHPWAFSATVARGQLGTAGLAAGGFSGEPGLPTSSVWDITIPLTMVVDRLERFSLGAPVVECITPISKAWFQYGDTTTLEHPDFLGYGLDGIVAGDGKWEAVLKELHVHDGEPHIRWVLVSANVQSPSYTDPVMRGTQPETGTALASAVDADVARGFAADGLTVSDGGGLTVNTTTGVMSAGIRRNSLPATSGDSVTASKDTYISFDVFSNSQIWQETALAAGTPAMMGSQVVVAKVVSGGAGIGSVDQTGMPTTAIDGVKLIDLSVDTAQIAASAVETDKLDALAVTNPKIGLLAVDTAQLASGAVETAKIDADAVTTAELGPLAVTATEVADGAVGITHVNLAQQHGGTLNANAALTMYTRG